MERPTTVIFDLGGVLIDWNPRYLYHRLFDDEPIPSTYLSLSAGQASERDGRLIVYGLTD